MRTLRNGQGRGCGKAAPRTGRHVAFPGSVDYLGRFVGSTPEAVTHPGHERGASLSEREGIPQLGGRYDPPVAKGQAVTAIVGASAYRYEVPEHWEKL